MTAPGPAPEPGPEGAHAAALAGLPGMTPRRLAQVLDGFQPVMAWHALVAGAHPADAERRLRQAAGDTDVDAVAERYRRVGVHVLLPGRPGYPSALIGDPGAPAMLFALGNPGTLEGGPSVAIVGTRAATPYGRRMAADLGRTLAAEGVRVVSGLAAGIDAAAHAGALGADPTSSGAPVAVVGTGVDVVYPTSSRELWDSLVQRGAVFSESPLGTQPRPGRFPARNRIIAAVSDVVVVVESHLKGGAMFTVDAAARRGIPVCAVPGSVYSRASAGSNALLVDGCVPVRDAIDVLVTLGLVRAGKNLGRIRGAGGRIRARPAGSDRHLGSTDSNRPTGSTGSGGRDTRGRERRPTGTRLEEVTPGRLPSLTPTQQALLQAVDDTPTAFETILLRTDLSIPAAAEACDELVEQGMLRSGAGWWSTA